MSEEVRRQSPTKYFHTRNLNETMARLEDFKTEKVKQIEHVLLVGFHHLVGSQIEFIYPPIEEDSECNLTAEFLSKIS